MRHEERIAEELNISPRQVTATIQLLDDGATVPFISRYRKEVTGSLDDLEVANIRDRIQQLRDLDTRREAILKSIDEQEKLTPELAKKINEATTMSALGTEFVLRRLLTTPSVLTSTSSTPTCGSPCRARR